MARGSSPTVEEGLVGNSIIEYRSVLRQCKKVRMLALPYRTPRVYDGRQSADIIPRLRNQEALGRC